MPGTPESRFHELKAAGTLPSPTGIALALLELTQRDDATIADIARLLQGDPALTGRLLKFVNSPYIGQRRGVVSVADAVLLVGLHAVRQIVLGLSVLSAHRDGGCEGFDYGRFWSGSLARAVAAEALCARFKDVPAEQAFTCGLLSGVGSLAFASVYPNKYSEILAVPRTATPQAMMDQEQAQFLTNHLELTVAMLCDWGLPALHYEAVEGMYDPTRVRPDHERAVRLAIYLRVAYEFAELCVGDPQIRGQITPGIFRHAKELGIESEELTELFDQVIEEWREWSAVLEVPSFDVPGFDEMTATADSQPCIAASTPSRVLRILAIDDDPTTLELLSHRLSDAGHEVRQAGSGRQGLKVAIEFNPDIVITDWMMPELDGIEFLKLLRRTSHGQRMYVIVLTAREEEQNVVEAFAAGADDYIVKPIVLRVLEARLQGAERLIRLREDVDREHEENRQHLADLAVANRRLEQAALTDALTKLPNRRYAMQRLRQVWSACGRRATPLSCMLVDIDHFKVVNDTYGHAQGDRTLCEIATVLRRAARNHDEVCRIGGEEFLVICSDTDVPAATAAAERLREAVAQHEHIRLVDNPFLTVSIGVAVQEPAATDPESIYRLADAAVYDAKHGGRNRVCVNTDSSDRIRGPRLLQAAVT